MQSLEAKQKLKGTQLKPLISKETENNKKIPPVFLKSSLSKVNILKAKL